MTDLVALSRETINEGSKSFALASRFLAPGVRKHASLLYAYCRYADDLVDGQTMGHGQINDYRTGQAERVAALRNRTEAALDGDVGDNPYLVSLARVVSETGMPKQYPRHLVDGFQMDADQRRYVTLSDTIDYGYHVAGVVGVMMAWVMGVRDDAVLDRASDLGIAFQLTNIARDVVDDARAGRVFVPDELLTDAGAPTDPARLAERRSWPAAYTAALGLLDAAEPYYMSAGKGIPHLGYRNGWAIETARTVYREIGETLREKGPEAWGQRVSTGKWTKLGLAAKASVTVLSAGRNGLDDRRGLYARPA